MKTEEKDVVQLLDKQAPDLNPSDESKGQTPNVSCEIRSGRKDKDDLTGRAYEYFQRLQ